MSDSGPDRFGKLLVRELRDPAIRHFDLLSKRYYAAKTLQLLQDKISWNLTEGQRQLLREVVVSCIDCGLESFLHAVEEGSGSDEGVWTARIDAAEVSEIGLGERMWAKDGWITRFSDLPPTTDQQR